MLVLLLLALSLSTDALTCSSTVAKLGGPNKGTSCENWKPGNTYKYPSGFPVLPSVTWYICPTSGYRIMKSNGIPNHDVTVNNPNSCCVNAWYVRLPLAPTRSENLTEPMDLGVIAMNINGVPMYGAQEAGGTNAADPAANAQIQDGQYWYGHAGFNSDWHYHNPWTGNSVQPSSDQLLGYAMDGYPLYGPLSDASVLDSCNGQFVTLASGATQYQYHVRNKDQVAGSGPYCNGTAPAILWNYILGCYTGSLSQTVVLDQSSAQATLPSDCYVDISVESFIKEEQMLWPHLSP